MAHSALADEVREVDGRRPAGLRQARKRVVELLAQRLTQAHQTVTTVPAVTRRLQRLAR